MVDTYNNSKYIDDAKKQLAILNGDASADTSSDTSADSSSVSENSENSDNSNRYDNSQDNGENGDSDNSDNTRITNKITKEKDMRRSMSFFSVRIQVINGK